MQSETPPLVTVYVLSYKHEAFIERCLRSIVHQTFRDFEIVFIDNNSPDKTFEKGLAVLENSGVRYVAERTKENLGCVRGLNYGLKKFAKGKYMTPLAGDDWWDMENLSYKVAFMEANPQYGMTYGNGYNYDNDTEEITLFYKKPSISGWILRDLLCAPNINPEGIMYRHDLLKELNYYDEGAKVEDRDLWYRVARVTEIGYVHKPLTFYRVNHSGNISRNIAHMKEGNEYFFQKYEKEFPKEIALARKRQWQYFAYYLATNEPGVNSLKFMLKNYKTDFLYNKQILKCVLNLVKR
ncbi:MAG: glycosyltransferase family 2 protein [Chitinophagaceae bacterium]|nr:MAG: glycosyltransferase family 2 protein [Chitinophagaceae bacterium]